MSSLSVEEYQKAILQFFHRVDHGLKYLNGKRAPLILLGLGYLLTLYRQATSYQHLLDEGITENPKILKPEDLHAQALKTVDPFFAHVQQKLGDEDLLDATAIQTLLNGGVVYAVKPDEVLDVAPLAAVLQY